MLSEVAWAGVNSLLDDYMTVRSGDCVAIAYAPDSKECAAWVAAALDERGIPYELVVMRPLEDATFAKRMQAAILSLFASRERLVVVTFERDTLSHEAALLKCVSHIEPERLILIRAISACPELFSLALQVKPKELTGKNTALLERLMTARTLRITTEGGTDLRVGLRSDRYRWVSNRGTAPGGGFVILPPGEVATFPDEINGLLVADFAFNVNTFTDLDARLATNPVTVEVKNGLAEDYACADPLVEALIAGCFRFPHGRRVGEVGFGTNAAIGDGIALNSHINERRPGVHLGFGDHNQYDLVDYKCRIHLDLIAKGARIWVDDDPTVIDLEHLAPSFSPHPEHTVHQDAFEFNPLGKGQHCCGVTTMVR